MTWFQRQTPAFLYLSVIFFRSNNEVCALASSGSRSQQATSQCRTSLWACESDPKCQQRLDNYMVMNSRIGDPNFKQYQHFCQRAFDNLVQMDGIQLFDTGIDTTVHVKSALNGLTMVEDCCPDKDNCSAEFLHRFKNFTKCYDYGVASRSCDDIADSCELGYLQLPKDDLLLNENGRSGLSSYDCREEDFSHSCKNYLEDFRNHCPISKRDEKFSKLLMTYEANPTSQNQNNICNQILQYFSPSYNSLDMDVKNKFCSCGSSFEMFPLFL